MYGNRAPAKHAAFFAFQDICDYVPEDGRVLNLIRSDPAPAYEPIDELVFDFNL